MKVLVLEIQGVKHKEFHKENSIFSHNFLINYAIIEMFAFT